MTRHFRLSILSVAAAAVTGCASTGGAGEGATAPAASAAKLKPAFVKSELMGRDARALDELLGAPALVRREGEGEFRRYALADCALIVILYPNENGARAAAYLDSAATRSNEPKPNLDACLARGLPAK
ncbi:MAG: hypothetical protein VX640_02205 [Pseudomonadota bacterium]|nr:hypothetical protein [Pseudomonadota bacterium]